MAALAYPVRQLLEGGVGRVPGLGRLRRLAAPGAREQRPGGGDGRGPCPPGRTQPGGAPQFATVKETERISLPRSSSTATRSS